MASYKDNTSDGDLDSDQEYWKLVAALSEEKLLNSPSKGTVSTQATPIAHSRFAKNEVKKTPSSIKHTPRDFAQSSTISPRNRYAGPETPSSSHSRRTSGTPLKRSKAITQAFNDIRLEEDAQRRQKPHTRDTYCPEKTPENLSVSRSSYHRSSAPKSKPIAKPSSPSNKAPDHIIVVDISDDDDDDDDEDSRVLTDTEPVVQSPPKPSDLRSPTTSSSSIGSFWSLASASSSASSLDEQTDHPPRNPLAKRLFPPAKSSYTNTLAASTTEIFDSSTISRVQPTCEQHISQPVRHVSDSTVPLEAVSAFARSEYGVALEVTTIAHCAKTQKIMDEKQIAWGVQYELARGVTQNKWDWSTVCENLDQLKGNNAQAAYKVRRVMLGGSSSDPVDLSVWQELDREQLALREGLSRGLGLMGSWEGDSDWYGGQIQQLARLTEDRTTKSFKIVLEPMEMRRSHRFARFCGSRSMLQLRMPVKLLQEKNSEVKTALNRKFVLCGRIFVPFYSKENSLYMVETNEESFRKSQAWCDDSHRQSFPEFINWHNPLEHNSNQAISKWVTRFALGLSNSVPALEFDEQNIIFNEPECEDLYSSNYDFKKKAEAEQIMTDGCGFINRTALRLIRQKFLYESMPTAVQGRISGAKGLWTLHPSDISPEPRIWIRKSQVKINMPYLDRAHKIFDLLTVSHFNGPIALSSQSIINLSFNGIPDDALISLMEKGLEDEINPLLDWTSPNAALKLGEYISRVGNVSGTRAQRLAAGQSRALGLEDRDWGDDDVSDHEDEDEDEDGPTATYSGRNEQSGIPLALSETAVELLQAGFHPATQDFLRTKIDFIAQQMIKSSVEKYRIPLPQSFGAFVIPDPCGVLEEGQIYYRSFRPIFDPITETHWQVLTGEVVLGRYPMRLPCDMQKVNAVDVPELYDWPDVIIVSTKGLRSLLSLLAGGDYDGDTLVAIIDRFITENFKNKPFTPPPDDLMTNFERQVQTVPAFCEKVKDIAPGVAQKNFQAVLLLSINESEKGMYSAFHDRVIIRDGYDHPNAIRLAYIFCTLLDASKTGHRLKPSIFAKDKKTYIPLPKESVTFILGRLKKAGNDKGEELLGQLETLPKGAFFDEDLKRPYEVANDFAMKSSDRGFKTFYNDLSRIRKHVEAARDLYLIAVAAQKEAPKVPKKKSRSAKKEDPMAVATRKYAEDIPGIELTPNVEEIKASYAYVLSRPPRHFAFQMAFRDLCMIKAKSSPGGIAPVIRSFDEVKSFSGSCMRALAKREENHF